MDHGKFPHIGRCEISRGSGRMVGLVLRDLPPDPSREETMALRVLVVDDHPAFRRALTSALRMVKDIEVAGEASGGIAAAEQAIRVEPDLVPMDLAMPDLYGIDAIRRIHKRR